MKPMATIVAVVKRSKQLGVLALSLMLLVGLSACTEKKAKVINWQLQSQATASSSDFKELLVMAEDIKVMSGGRLIITPMPGGTVTNGPDIFNAVKDGRVAMGNGWPNWWSGQHPAWAVMNAGGKEELC